MRRPQRLDVRVVQPAIGDPAETARRLRAIADIALAARPINSTVVAPSVVSPGMTATGRPAPQHPGL